MTSITISLVVIESIIIMLLSNIVDFLLICIITLCYLTLYADLQLKIAIFWSSKTIVLCGALMVKVCQAAQASVAHLDKHSTLGPVL